MSDIEKRRPESDRALRLDHAEALPENITDVYRTLGRAEIRDLGPGDVLIEAGQAWSRCMYFVTHGRFRLVEHGYLDKFIGPRQMIGETDFYLERESTITAVAVEPSRVVVVDDVMITEFVVNPRFTISLVKRVLGEKDRIAQTAAGRTRRLEEAERQIAEASEKIAELEALGAEQADELARVRSDLTKANRALADETMLLQQAERLMKEANERAEAAEAALAALQQELGERLTEALQARDSAAASLQEAGRQIVEHLEARQVAEQSNQQLSQICDARQQRIRELERLLKAEQTLGSTAAKRVEVLEKRLRDQREQYQADENERQKVMVEYHVQSAYASRLERQLQAEIATSTRLRGERAEAERQRDALQQELDQLRGVTNATTVGEHAPTSTARRSNYQPRHSNPQAIDLAELKRAAEQEARHKQSVRPPAMILPESHGPALTLHLEDDPSLLGDRPAGLGAVPKLRAERQDETTKPINLSDVEVIGTASPKKTS